MNRKQQALTALRDCQNEFLLHWRIVGSSAASATKVRALLHVEADPADVFWADSSESF